MFIKTEAKSVVLLKFLWLIMFYRDNRVDIELTVWGVSILLPECPPCYHDKTFIAKGLFIENERSYNFGIYLLFPYANDTVLVQNFLWLIIVCNVFFYHGNRMDLMSTL